MLDIKEGDELFTFMGEDLIHFVVTAYNPDIDQTRLAGEDVVNTYCVYAHDCYRTKEEAIEGMLEALREITDCDCGEDEALINDIYDRLPPNCS